jgi:FkbM family methyltransferase
VEQPAARLANDQAAGPVSAGGAVNRLLAPLGLTLQRTPGPGRATVERALGRLPELGVDPRTVIDVGAAYGDWSEVAGRLFPNAQLLLVEPLAEFAPFLKERKRRLPRATVIAAAAGRSAGTATLHVHPDLVGTSLRVEPELGATGREVPVVTIDDLIEREGADGPFVLKLDVQGGELDALAGASSTLPRTELVQLETLLFPFYEGAPGLAEVVSFMHDAGFVVYDVVDLGYRPLDGALSQVDLLFVPEASALRRHREYATAEQRRASDDALRALFERRQQELRR